MAKVKEGRNETLARIRKFKDGLYYHSTQTIQDINFLLNEMDTLTLKLSESEAVLDAAKEEIGRLEKELQRFRDGGVEK
jgi:hypothetical protein